MRINTALEGLDLAAPGLALFDFDGTICRGDSILPFLLFCIRHGAAPALQLPRAAGAYLAGHGEGSLRRVKETTLSFLAGQPVQRVDETARAFLRRYLRRAIDPELLSLLQHLREHRWTSLVVSASPDCYMRLLSEFLPVTAVLATRCEVSDGLYTGHVGPNCKGDEKVRRVTAWLKANPALSLPIRLAAGDSPSDIPMLRLAPTQLLVHPNRELRASVPQGLVIGKR